MPVLTQPDLIAVWEAGAVQPDWRRALIALAPVLADHDETQLRGLSLGTRNAHLLALRGATIGPLIRVFVQCPVCGEPLEFEQAIAELLDGYQPPVTHGFTLALAGHALHCRLLTSDDLAAIADLPADDQAQAALLRRVVVSAACDDQPIDPDQQSPEWRAQIAREVALRDPLSRLAIPVACAACAHVWPAEIEIVRLLWAELGRAARTALDDVVVLARGYGWSEAEIMAMSPQRRRFYSEALG